MKSRQTEPVPQTREEKIAEALRQHHNLNKTPRMVTDPTWHFKVGDLVNAGGWAESRIEEIREDGRLLIIANMQWSRDRDGPKVLLGPTYQARWWFSVLPALPSHTEGQLFTKRNAWNRRATTHLSSLIREACQEEFRDNPDYQRGYVWNDDDRQRFIEAAFQGRELGLFVFVQFPYPDVFTEVLDGKQRINCLKDFAQGRFRYQGRLWYEFSNFDRSTVESHTYQYVNLDGAHMKRSELLEIFLEVNAAGVPQSQEHLDHVRALYAEAIAAERGVTG